MNNDITHYIKLYYYQCIYNLFVEINLSRMKNSMFIFFIEFFMNR